MAYDGIITYGISVELEKLLVPGKIEKVYQPGSEDLVLQIHSAGGNYRLFASCGSETARAAITDVKYRNPEIPPNFCMLLRKHIQSGHITAIRQVGSERIIEIDIESLSEMGFTVGKRLIIEIMGKHSNILLTEISTGKIIDCIKHISIDVNRYRQLFPGVIYKYPPAQDKIPFKKAPEAISEGRLSLARDEKLIMANVGGISPAAARELAASENPGKRLSQMIEEAKSNPKPVIYSDGETLREFHLTELSEYSSLEKIRFGTVSECVEFYYQNRAKTNTIKIKSVPIIKGINAHLEKAHLKEQRIREDILRAEDSDKYRLYGELLTANIHLVAPGAKSVTVTNYYNGEPISIPLDERFAAAKNAQNYFKKYAKAKTALKEKTIRLEETTTDIKYLESVLQSAESARTEEELDSIKDELIKSGYIRYRAKHEHKKKKTAKPQPLSYTLSDGSRLIVGRNNTENDYITTSYAARGDLWFHTKDIPGSHCVLNMEKRTVDELSDSVIFEAASIAAYHSKGKDSENVPVDFTYIRYVKKPSGAKPGMVIFTHNTTVYVTPGLPENAQHQ